MDFVPDMKKRISQEQKKLKELSDDTIRQMHLDTLDPTKDKAIPISLDPIKQKKALDDEAQKIILHAAIRAEVQRRWQAVSWIWKRKSHAEDYEKWNEHQRQSEIKAAEYSIYLLSKDADPSNPQTQEAIERYKNYIKALRSTPSR